MNTTPTFTSRRLFAGLVALVVCFGSPSLRAEEVANRDLVTTVFLEIPGIAGEATDPGYEGQIEVLSYSGTTGGGAGELTLTKNIDSSSPALLLLVATGNVVNTATLTVVGSGITKIEMRNVLVTSVSNGGLTETVTLSFQNSKVTNKKGGTKPEPVFNTYLDIKGIEGDVADRGFEGQIGVLSYSWSPTSGPGELSLTKYIDSSSASLFALVALGTPLKSARLTIVQTVNGKNSRMTIDMRDVLVTSISTGTGTESLTLSFQRSKFTQ